MPEPDLPPRGALPALILARDKAPLRAFSLHPRGAKRVDAPPALERRALARWREEQAYSFVATLHLDELPELGARLARAIALEADLAAQAFAAFGVIKPLLGHQIVGEPTPWPESAKLPPYRLLETTFDRVIPDERSFVLYVFEGREVWASLVARKRARKVDLVTSHRALSFRPSSPRDAKRVCDEVARRFAPPHFAAFVPLSVWRRFVGGDRAALAAAMAARQAAVDPCPRWLLALIGAGAVTEAARRSARLAGRLLSKTPIGGFLGAAPEQLVEKMGNPLEALGLDPWELMRWARTWSRRALPLIVDPELLSGEHA